MMSFIPRFAICFLFLFPAVLLAKSHKHKTENTFKYPCCIYSLYYPELPQGEISYINGMNHKPDRAVQCGEVISDLTGDYNTYIVYNPTKGFWRDLLKCFVELYHYKITPPVEKLHEKWDAFFADCGPNEKLLQFCHSEGAIQVRNALIRYHPQYRKRIVVIGIAPAAYIPDVLCGGAFHYVSRRDIVPALDRKGYKRCREKTVLLTPHPDASFFDHHFLSPTFHNAIHHHLHQFMISECGMRAAELTEHCLPKSKDKK